MASTDSYWQFAVVSILKSAMLAPFKASKMVRVQTMLTTLAFNSGLITPPSTPHTHTRPLSASVPLALAVPPTPLVHIRTEIKQKKEGRGREARRPSLIVMCACIGARGSFRSSKTSPRSRGTAAKQSIFRT